MGKTTIAWTDHSVNPIRYGKGHYCQKLSPGCQNCYASRMQGRFGGSAFKGTGGEVPPIADRQIEGHLWLDTDKLHEVVRRRKPTRFFWCDMTDLFGSWVPDGWIDDCFRAMFKSPQHTHQVLTKRPERMLSYCSKRWGTFNGKDYPPAPNVHLGVSVEDQQRADERIPLLLQCPAAVRFLSVEPLLGPVDLGLHLLCRHCDGHEDLQPKCGPALDWVIVGGESGPHARPCNVAWIRSLVEQCKAAGVAVFVKQLGKVVRSELRDENNPAYRGYMDATYRDAKGGDPNEWPADLRIQEFPT